MDIGLIAKVKPELDTRKADEEAGKLRQRMQESVEEIEVGVDMQEAVENAGEMKEQVNSMDTEFEWVSPGDLQTRGVEGQAGGGGGGGEPAKEIAGHFKDAWNRPVSFLQDTVEEFATAKDGLVSKFEENIESMAEQVGGGMPIMEGLDLMGMGEDGGVMGGGGGGPEEASDSDVAEAMAMQKGGKMAAGRMGGSAAGGAGSGGKLAGISSKLGSISGSVGSMSTALLAGGAAVAIAGLGLLALTKIWDGIKALGEHSPLLGTVVDILGMAMSLFFRPFGNIIGQLLMPIAAGMIKLAAGFNKVFGNQGILEALAWLSKEIIIGLLEGFWNIFMDLPVLMKIPFAIAMAPLITNVVAIASIMWAVFKILSVAADAIMYFNKVVDKLFNAYVSYLTDVVTGIFMLQDPIGTIVSLFVLPFQKTMSLLDTAMSLLMPFVVFGFEVWATIRDGINTIASAWEIAKGWFSDPSIPGLSDMSMPSMPDAGSFGLPDIGLDDVMEIFPDVGLDDVTGILPDVSISDVTDILPDVGVKAIIAAVFPAIAVMGLLSWVWPDISASDILGLFPTFSWPSIPPIPPIGSVIGGVSANIRNFGGRLAGGISGLAQDVSSGASRVAGNISGFARDIGRGASKVAVNIGGLVSNLASGAASLGGRISNFASSIASGASKVGSKITGFASDIASGAAGVKGSLTSAAGDISSAASGALSDISSKAQGALGDITSKVSSGVGTLNSKISSGVSELEGVISRGLDQLEDIGGDPVDTGSSYVQGGANYVDEGLSTIGLASGGVVTSATPAMVGEGRESEAVLPLSRLDAMLSNSPDGGGMGGSSVNVEVNSQTGGGGDVASQIEQALGSRLDSIDAALNDVLAELAKGDFVGDVEVSVDGKTIAEASSSANDKYRDVKEVNK